MQGVDLGKHLGGGEEGKPEEGERPRAQSRCAACKGEGKHRRREAEPQAAAGL